MLFNLSSKIILQIIFPDFEQSLKKISGAETIAVSPLMAAHAGAVETDAAIAFHTALYSYEIKIIIENFQPRERKKIMEYCVLSGRILVNSLSILFGREFESTIPVHAEIDTGDMKEIDIAFIYPECERYVKILITLDFFRLFSKTITPKTQAHEIENAILEFFKNQKWMLIDLKYLILSLNEIELGRLFNQLRKKGLLTPYQIFLMIHAYPEVSLKIKKCISKSTAADVIDFKHRSVQLKITARDIAGGLYSIEEALFFLIRDEADFSYSLLLREIQNIMHSAGTLELFLAKEFDVWIHDIVRDNCLYDTVAVSDDLTIACAFSGESKKNMELLKDHISQKKLREITALAGRDFTFIEMLGARACVIKNYRRVKSVKIRQPHESFEYLLARFACDSEYLHLLLSTGWFTLSTALKGTKRKFAARIIRALPKSAGYLIEDVLNGTINPDVIHDEMQVNSARKKCAVAILRLYEAGIIRLEE